MSCIFRILQDVGFTTLLSLRSLEVHHHSFRLHVDVCLIIFHSITDNGAIAEGTPHSQTAGERQIWKEGIKILAIY